MRRVINQQIVLIMYILLHLLLFLIVLYTLNTITYPFITSVPIGNDINFLLRKIVVISAMTEPTNPVITCNLL